MDMEVIDLGGNTVKIVLSGRFDRPGDKVETRFTAECAATSRNAIIDLSDVPFIASMGIRMLIVTARVMRRRGFNMILFGIQKLVQDLLNQASLNDIIPVVENEEQALELLKLRSVSSPVRGGMWQDSVVLFFESDIHSCCF